MLFNGTSHIYIYTFKSENKLLKKKSRKCYVDQTVTESELKKTSSERSDKFHFTKERLQKTQFQSPHLRRRFISFLPKFKVSVEWLVNESDSSKLDAVQSLALCELKVSYKFAEKMHSKNWNTV